MSDHRLKLIEINGTAFYLIDGELYPEYLNRGNAAEHILHIADAYCRGRGIDIGGGDWPYPGAAAVIDRKMGGDAYDLSQFSKKSLDWIFSSHLLEHLDRPREAIAEWSQKLRTNGHLFLYLPHPACKLWHPGGVWVGDGHKWMPELESVIAMFWAAGIQPVKFTREHDAYWSWFIVGKKQG